MLGGGAGGEGGGVVGGGAGALAPPSADRYGIAGLLGVIRTVEPSLNMLALGTDLTALGLDIASPEPLHAGFAVPWADRPVAKEPSLTLPATYRVPQPALKTGHFGKFTVGTLIYIFYSMPRDVLQAHSAQELYAREWRYHRDRKLWFRREGDGSAGPPTYAYWDLLAWEKRAFTGPVASLVQGFLPEEEVKIRRADPAAAAAAAAAQQAAAVQQTQQTQPASQAAAH